MSTRTPEFEQLRYGPRYFVQTAMNAIESLGHIVAEAVSNEDEAISRRAIRDSDDDSGRIRIAYDPVGTLFSVTGDGDGMSANTQRERLLNVGVEPKEGSKRGFFHRGIREVFLALGGGTVTSIGLDERGHEVISEAVFDPDQGMALTITDDSATDEQRESLGLARTGTQVQIPMARWAGRKPHQFEFGTMEWQIRDCVGIRPVLTDPKREVLFEFGSQPPRKIEFAYPEGENLVAMTTITIEGLEASFWAKVADKPLAGSKARQLRRSGILIRGERAAYEVSTGEKLGQHPAMGRVFGELRIDAIEELQRAADATGDEAQLIYKTDRSGLNSEHPLTQAIETYIDETLAPLIEDLDAAEEKKEVSADMRRQLQKLARAINQVVRQDIKTVEDTEGGPTKTSDPDEDRGGDPPDPPEERLREVADGIGFAYDRIFIGAGESRTVEVWIDTTVIGEGTEVVLASRPDDIITAHHLAHSTVPPPGKDGIAAVDVTMRGGSTEGRFEVVASAAGHVAELPVHVRFPRASGFISNIVLSDQDWPSGSALWNPSSGVVTVYVGRPEFKDAAARARREGEKDAAKHPLYRELIVESVREAALWDAAALHAQVEWDELPYEERQARNAFHNQVRIAFQELDYQLRAKLLKTFLEG